MTKPASQEFLKDFSRKDKQYLYNFFVIVVEATRYNIKIEPRLSIVTEDTRN